MSEYRRQLPPFAITPEWVLDAVVPAKGRRPARHITARAIQLYAVLWRYADKTDHSCYPSQATLAHRCDCSVDSVQRALADLEAIGAVVCTHRSTQAGRTSSRYTLMQIEPEEIRKTAEVRPSAKPQDSAAKPHRSGLAKPQSCGREQESLELEPVERDTAQAPPRKKSARDLLHDALAESVGMNLETMTRPANREVGFALSLIEEADPSVSAEEIRRRALAYKSRHPNWELTAPSLAKRWSELEPKPVVYDDWGNPVD